MTSLCRRCGKLNPKLARFCRNCGMACDAVSVRSLTRLTPLLRQWRLISHKLTRKDVHKLLGEPARRDVVSSGRDSVETWTYAYATIGDSPAQAAGQVHFMLPDGRVSTWSEPDWTQLPSNGREPQIRESGQTS